MKAATAQTRIQLKNILFATDFSESAAVALPFAAEIARQFHAKLTAVHAKTPENYALPAAEIWVALDAELEREAEQLRGKLRHEFPSLETEVVMAEGGVWGVVEALAEQKHADLIVVGTHGRSGMGKFVLGSVAEEILRQATCPVLTVGPHCLAEAPADAKFQRILYATDFGEGSTLAARYALSVAQEHQAHLTLLHVIEHPKTGDLVRPHELESAAIGRLRGLVAGEAAVWCEPKFVVREGPPTEKILELAKNERADLIVLGIRNAKGIFRTTHLANTVAHQVISMATCPVLTVCR